MTGPSLIKKAAHRLRWQRGIRDAGLVSLAVVSLLTPVGRLGASAAAKDTAAPVVRGIVISPSRVAVSGLKTVVVTVNVRLSDDTGVKESYVELTHVPEPGPSFYADSRILRLTAGTSRAGTWSATLNIPSTYDGVWHVSAVWAKDVLGNEAYADSTTFTTDHKLIVVAPHHPTVSVRFFPNPVVGTGPRKIVMAGYVRYADTGKPIPGLRLSTSQGNGCYTGEDRPDYTMVRTNSDGRYAVTYDYDQITYFVGFSMAGTMALCRDKYPDIKFLVGAAVAPATICLGQSAAVTGHVLPKFDPLPGEPEDPGVALQHLVSGTWRTVGKAHVRASGRYTLTATPPTPGIHAYRVWKIGYKIPEWRYYGALSRMVLVRAERC